MKTQHYIREIFFSNISKLLLISFALLALFGCKCDGNGDGAPFGVSGTVSDVNLSSPKVNAMPNNATGITTTADYVYAVNTRLLYLTMERRKAPISADGSFSINLTKGDPWILAFIDTSEVGEAMIKGVFSADQLDAIAPKISTANDETNVGNVVVDEFGGAELPSENYITYIGDLGLNMTEAATFGGMDDGVLRYINPDLDGNGILDMDDPAFPKLKLQWRQEYRYGGSALLDNLRNGVPLPLDDVFSLGVFGWLGTQINLIVEQQSSGIFSGVPGRFTLEMENVGDYTGDNPAFWTPSASSYGLYSGVSTDFGNEVDYYFSLSPDVYKVPDGKYTFRFYSDEAGVNLEKTITFSHVASMADARDTSDFVIPFPVFNTDQNGNITSISYTWMKYAAGAFIYATADDVELMVGNQDANISWMSVGCGQADCNGASVDWQPVNNGFSPTGTLTSFNWRPDVSHRRSDIQRMSTGYVSNTGIWINMVILGD